MKNRGKQKRLDYYFIFNIVLVIALFFVGIPIFLERLDPLALEANKLQYSDNHDIELAMSNFEFDKEVIYARRGQTLRINLINEEGLHNFEVPGLNLKTPILRKNQNKLIEIHIPNDSEDEYMFESSYNDSDELGMRGVILVQS